MKPLVEYCRGAVSALTFQYEMTKVLGHSTTAGSARERLIRDFLAAHLPEMTTVVSGIIVDSTGSRSKQQDLVLMLKSMPRLPFSSGDDLIFQEGAVATIEIKTNVDSRTLEAIGHNVRSVRALRPSSMGGLQLGELTWPYGRILSIVVTYDGMALGCASDILKGLGDGKPDIYFDLTKGILIKNEGFLLPIEGEQEYLKTDQPDIGLARLLTLLATVTGRLVMHEVSWEDYIA